MPSMATTIRMQGSTAAEQDEVMQRKMFLRTSYDMANLPSIDTSKHVPMTSRPHVQKVMASVFSLDSSRDSMAGTQYQTKFGSLKNSVHSKKRSMNSKSPSNVNEDLKVSIN